MFLFRVVLATLAFASFVRGGVASPLHSGSNGDQYQRRIGAKRGGKSQVEMARFHDKDATDRELGLTGRPKDDTQRSTHSGFVFETTTPRTFKENDETIDKSGEGMIRHKRGYIRLNRPPIDFQNPQLQSLSSWHRSYYPLQRPYYITFFATDGRIPIYIPNSYINPGNPPHNPYPYVGPTYLPPYVPPTYLPPTQNTSSRDGPIWYDPTDAPVVPTRKPNVKVTPFPPLVHRDDNNPETTAQPLPQVDNNLSTTETSGPIWDNEPPMVSTRGPPSRTTPPTPGNNMNHLSTNGAREREPSTSSPPANLPGPSRCVWAIVSCCSTASSDVSNECFEQLGCSGPFWDVKPCESEFAKSAIESALNYYNSRT
ncbi:hypothetical protein HHI36_012422 [Cryptolaemus montrouzieri]|uniref:Uncharacterized protein n=1 Tax=Cryptolaemus montrouzieri TaxID=559131 RepID=A0ABD2NFN2_9CUCU